MREEIIAGILAAGLLLFLPPLNAKAAEPAWLSPEYRGDLGEIPQSESSKKAEAEAREREQAAAEAAEREKEAQTEEVLRDAALWREHVKQERAKQSAPKTADPDPALPPIPEAAQTPADPDSPPLPGGLVFVDRNFNPIPEEELQEKVLHDSREDLTAADRKAAAEAETVRRERRSAPVYSGNTGTQVLTGSDFARTGK